MRFACLFIFSMTLVCQIPVDSMLVSGQRLESKNRLKEAIDVYVETVKTYPKSSEGFRHLANALCEFGFLYNDNVQKEVYYRQAIKAAEMAVKLNPDYNQTHYTLARSYGRLTQVVGLKEQMSLAQKIKDEADLTVRLNPQHDLAWHIIGKWNFRFAELNWFEKTVANTIFGDIPENATFANALAAFEKAAKLAPTNVAHLVELARTLLELDRKDEAKAALKMAVALPPAKRIDKKYIDEAKQLLVDI